MFGNCTERSKEENWKVDSDVLWVSGHCYTKRWDYYAKLNNELDTFRMKLCRKSAAASIIVENWFCNENNQKHEALDRLWISDG